MLRCLPFTLLVFAIAAWCDGLDTACAVENVLRSAFTNSAPIELRPAAPRTKVGRASFVDSSTLPSPPVEATDEDDLAENTIHPIPADDLAADPNCGIDGEFYVPPTPGRMHQGHRAQEPTPIERLWRQRFTRATEGHNEPNDPLRHFGIGEPLIGTSWRNRPWYVNGFVGGLIGDELQSGLVDQGGGFFIGGRFGGDFDHFWGSEVRVAFSDLNVNYPNITRSGQSNVSFFDASLLYYPLGDTRWRPYIALGFGIGGFKYDDADGKQIHASAISLPFGGGLKYLLNRQWAMRFDITDNFTWDSGSHADSMHNISFTGGIEYHFGGNVTSYDPW